MYTKKENSSTTAEINPQISLGQKEIGRRRIKDDNQLVQEYCSIWLRDLDTKKIGAEVFGEL